MKRFFKESTFLCVPALTLNCLRGSPLKSIGHNQPEVGTLINESVVFITPYFAVKHGTVGFVDQIFLHTAITAQIFPVHDLICLRKIVIWTV